MLAGDILLDAPSKLMSKVINAPSEKFEDKLAQSMDQWLSSLRKELGESIERRTLKKHLVDGFRETLGIQLKLEQLSGKEKLSLKNLIKKRSTEEWIFGKDLEHNLLLSKSSATSTKVREGVTVSEAIHKLGKMIRVTLISEDNTLRGISISGDFFTQPYLGAIEALEKSLVGTQLIKEDLNKNVAETFKKIGLTVYGASPEDFVTAIIKAKMKED